MSSKAIKAEVERGKKLLAEHSRYLQAQYAEWQRDRTMFPSCEPGGRGAVSPLGNVSPDEAWSGKKS